MSKLHPKIVKPKLPFCELRKDQQEFMLAVVKGVIERLPPVGILSKRESVKAVIELINTGLLRIHADVKQEVFHFTLFDLDRGEYVAL